MCKLGHLTLEIIQNGGQNDPAYLLYYLHISEEQKSKVMLNKSNLSFETEPVL